VRAAIIFGLLVFGLDFLFQPPFLFLDAATSRLPPSEQIKDFGGQIQRVIKVRARARFRRDKSGAFKKKTGPLPKKKIRCKLVPTVAFPASQIVAGESSRFRFPLAGFGAPYFSKTGQHQK
jgi:hypothetical protein